MIKIKFSTKLPLQNPSVRKGTVNIHNLLSRPNSSFSFNLLKNGKVSPNLFGMIFYPTLCGLETHNVGVLEARGGKNPLLSFITSPVACNEAAGLLKFADHVSKTPVRYNGGQVYKFGQYYLLAPVINLKFYCL